jgi:intein/homing endonuclease
MAGSWEFGRPEVLVAILTRGVVPTRWAVAYRKLDIPGGREPIFLSGMPFDHARNEACKATLKGGFRWCFFGDVLVETTKGPRPIQDIVTGDLVRTHRGRYRKVTDTFSRMISQGDPLIWIRTKHSLLKCTPDHPFLVLRHGEKRFIRAKNLGVKDVLLYPDRRRSWDRVALNIRFNANGPDGTGRSGSIKNARSIDSLDVDREVARFLGLYLAEGCSGHDGIRFTFGNHELDLIKWTIGFCQRVFGRKPTIHKRWATTVKLNIRPLGGRFARWFGRRAPEKRIPDIVFRWSLQNQLAFLSGYLDGDGSVSKGKYVSFRTSSDALAKDLLRLARVCGLAAKIVRVKGRNAKYRGKTIKTKPSWHGWFAKRSSDKIGDLVNARASDGYLHVPIVSVERHACSSGLVDPVVYNLEVEEDHSYVVDVVSAHNCFFLDDDVMPPPDTIPRLIAHEKDIVSGLYFRRAEPIQPVMLRDGKPKPTFILDYQPGQVVEADLVGAGCLLIHRRVLEALQKNWFEWKLGRDDEIPEEERASEDFVFARKAKRAGFQIYVDTGIQCFHAGYGRSDARGQFVPLEV